MPKCLTGFPGADTRAEGMGLIPQNVGCKTATSNEELQNVSVMDVYEVDWDGRNWMQKEEVCHLYAETREDIYGGFGGFVLQFVWFLLNVSVSS